MNRLEKFLVSHKGELVNNLNIDEKELLNRTYGINIHFEQHKFWFVDSSNTYFASFETGRNPDETIDFETIIREVIGLDKWKEFAKKYNIYVYTGSKELDETKHTLQFLEIYKDGLIKSSNFSYIDMEH